MDKEIKRSLKGFIISDHDFVYMKVCDFLFKGTVSISKVSNIINIIINVAKALIVTRIGKSALNDWFKAGLLLLSSGKTIKKGAEKKK